MERLGSFHARRKHRNGGHSSDVEDLIVENYRTDRTPYTEIDEMDREDPLNVQRYKRKTWGGVEYNILNYEEDKYLYAGMTAEEKLEAEVRRIRSWMPVVKWAIIFTIIGIALTAIIVHYLLTSQRVIDAFSGAYGLILFFFQISAFS